MLSLFGHDDKAVFFLSSSVRGTEQPACCCGSRTCFCWTEEHAGPAAMASAVQTRQGLLPSSLVLARHRAGERSPGRGVAVVQVRDGGGVP